MSESDARHKLLILTGDRDLRRELEGIFSEFALAAGEGGEQVPALVRRFVPEVVLFDLGPGREPGSTAQALDILRQILTLAPDTKLIAMMEPNARDLAVQAVGLGATDFYFKPIDSAVL